MMILHGEVTHCGQITQQCAVEKVGPLFDLCNSEQHDLERLEKLAKVNNWDTFEAQRGRLKSKTRQSRGENVFYCPQFHEYVELQQTNTRLSKNS
jgi:hypothetical protein